MRRILAPTLPTQQEPVALGAATSHHLLRVLRLGVGTSIVAFDGLGQEVVAVVERIDGDTVVLRATAEAVHTPEPTAVHLLLAVPKGPAAEQAIRMAVELGVTDLHPVHSQRTVPRGDPGDRWTRIAGAAARQCGRRHLPRVHPAQKLQESVRCLPMGLALRVAVPGAPRRQAPEGAVAVVIGPEGGLAPAEEAWLLTQGFEPMGLADHVLRVDTAVAVAVASVMPAEPQSGPTAPPGTTSPAITRG